MSHAAAALLALAIAAAPAPADPAAATHAIMQGMCTELSLPCNACGGRKADSAGPPPTPRPADDPMRRPVDAWGNRLQITVGGGGVALRSAGADGAMNSADDIVESCSGAGPSGAP